MALRNDRNELSDFGNRLMDLMESKGYTSARQLAERLYDLRLVTVNQKKDPDVDKYKKKENAIESVEKKINKHLKAEDAYCLQGEFVKAQDYVSKGDMPDVDELTDEMIDKIFAYLNIEQRFKKAGYR